MYALLREVLSIYGDLQVRFTPVGSKTEWKTPGPVPFALDYQDAGDDPEGEPNALWHLFAAGATGPPIEIYRLDLEKLANPQPVIPD